MLLHTVQSNVSARIIKLENHLRVQLFLRRRRGSLATADGVRLYQYAKRVLSLIEEIEKDIVPREIVRSGPVYTARVTGDER